MTTTYGALVATYLAEPTPATLAALRSAVRSAPGFTPDLAADALARPLLDRGAYGEAVTALSALMPGAMLSPSAHTVLAEALTGAGRTDAARREESLARAALSSILSTGDGTAARPWSVLRVSDEYDVLSALGKRSRRQSVDRVGSRHLDRHECEDGSELVFDVTGLFPRG
ncbi:DUF4919 domain-containing protein [Nocardioides lijunqiniae]|uniref:DUF4919 domain-containing protein n=1 Tax=Nocardioides lijunqiniae TaxID=2760832 RepID=UPI00187869EE|nr:DUF4919 domain-containing protein [Nocardioides lijunqiniae]